MTSLEGAYIYFFNIILGLGDISIFDRVILTNERHYIHCTDRLLQRVNKILYQYRFKIKQTLHAPCRIVCV